MPYIYALKDADGSVRYIGKANDPDKRLKSHMRDSVRRDTPVYRWIRKNGKPIMEVLTDDIEDWKEAERRIIAEHRDAGHALLNVADGGDEPFCPKEVRAANGRKNAIVRETGPMAELNVLKRRLGLARKNGHLRWKTEVRLGEMARKTPWLFPTMVEWGLHYGPPKPLQR